VPLAHLMFTFEKRREEKRREEKRREEAPECYV
jgi:hypothetical protein